MKKSISIDSEGEAGKRGIYLDEQSSHHIRETELDQALTDARQNFWKTSSHLLSDQAMRLYFIKKPGRYGHFSALGCTVQGQKHGCKDFGVL